MERYLNNLAGGPKSPSSEDSNNLGHTGRTQQENNLHPPDSRQQPVLLDGISIPSYLESLSLFRRQQRAAAAQVAFAMAENQLSASTLRFANQINPLSSYPFLPGSLRLSGDDLLRANYPESNPFLLQQFVHVNNSQQFYPHNSPSDVGASATLADDRSTADHYADRGILGPWSVTSAGVLDKIAQLDKADGSKKKAALRRKPKDRPKRPLSAYNIFFKDERGRILSEIPGEHQNEHGNKQGKKKKSPHGKIGFESLAKTIGQRWQCLDPTRVAYYKSKATEDMVRYKEEMEIFLAKQAGKTDDENAEQHEISKTAAVDNMSQPRAKRRRIEKSKEDVYQDDSESDVEITG